jgi:hypothetical protein
MYSFVLGEPRGVASEQVLFFDTFIWFDFSHFIGYLTASEYPPLLSK